MHSQRVIPLCRFWSGGISGRYFFEKGEAAAVTANVERYCAMVVEIEVKGMTTFSFNRYSVSNHRKFIYKQMTTTKRRFVVIGRG